MNNELYKLIQYIKITYELENINISDTEIINIIKKKQERKKEMTKKQVYQTWEDYLIEGTTTLKNIPNIKNDNELNEYEKQMSAKRLIELYKEPISNTYDLKHLCKIHEYLFQDIYEWAGEIRNVNMMKQTVFLEPEKIRQYVKILLEETKENITKSQNKFELASHLSNLFYCLIHAHPFREGNGRTIREFIRQLVNSIDFDFGAYSIDYTKIEKNNIAYCIECGAPMFITPSFQKALINRKN